MKRPIVLGTLAGLAGLTLLVFGALQLMPWSIERNPPITQEPAWDSPQTRTLARQAGCMDCHSNETVWPWYSEIAPVGWLVVEHVADGRRQLNLSELDKPQDEAHEAGEVVLEGEMPPAYYVALHPEAALTPAQRQALAAGLDRTLAGIARGDGGGGHGADHGEHDDDDDD